MNGPGGIFAHQFVPITVPRTLEMRATRDDPPRGEPCNPRAASNAAATAASTWASFLGRRTARSARCRWECPQRTVLAYIGNVGTGFTETALRDLHRRLQQLEILSAPFDAIPVPHEFARFARWVRPDLAGEVIV